MIFGFLASGFRSLFFRLTGHQHIVESDLGHQFCSVAVHTPSVPRL